jgi:hypothetical protein
MERIANALEEIAERLGERQPPRLTEAQWRARDFPGYRGIEPETEPWTV